MRIFFLLLLLLCFYLLVEASWPFQRSGIKRPAGRRPMMRNSAPEPDFEFNNNVSFVFAAHFEDSECTNVKMYVGFPNDLCTPITNDRYVAYSCWREGEESGLYKTECFDDKCQNCSKYWESIDSLDTCSPYYAGGYTKIVCPKSGLSPIRPAQQSTSPLSSQQATVVRHVQSRDYFYSHCSDVLESIRGFVAVGCQLDPTTGTHYLFNHTTGSLQYGCTDDCSHCNSTIIDLTTGGTCQNDMDSVASHKFVVGEWLASQEDALPKSGIAQSSTASSPDLASAASSSPSFSFILILSLISFILVSTSHL